MARLLCQERGEAAAALAVVQQVRQGRYSRKPVSGDRLPLDFLDTLGLVYREARHYKEAVELFMEASRRYGDEPRIYLQLGRSYAGLKQYRAALDHLNHAVRLATDKADGSRDPRRKAQLLAVAEEAGKERQKLVGQMR
jgi:tetratricopeptide (TPR) repeat protein